MSVRARAQSEALVPGNEQQKNARASLGLCFSGSLSCIHLHQAPSRDRYKGGDNPQSAGAGYSVDGDEGIIVTTVLLRKGGRDGLGFFFLLFFSYLVGMHPR